MEEKRKERKKENVREGEGKTQTSVLEDIRN